MSMIFGDFVWLATGGKGQFKRETLKPIKTYDIVAFPDKDGIQQWTEVADKLNKYGYSIHVNTTLENLDVDENADLADIFLAGNDTFKTRIENPVEPPKTTPVMRHTHPEKVVAKMAVKNQAIYTLIEEFDLVDDAGREIKKA